MRIRTLAAHVAVLYGTAGIVWLTSGCVVSESKYKSATQELKTCKTDRDDLVVERNALSEKVGGLQTKLQDEMNATREELDALRKQREEIEKQLAEFQKLTDTFKEMVAAEGIKVDVRRGRMIVSLPSGVLFASGKADISKRGASTLKRVAGKLKEFKDRRFIVAGHTDNVPLGKDVAAQFQDNWQLSAVRALTVIRFLIEQGIDPRNLAAAGYGQYDPVKSNRKKSGRRLNRRIELILEPKLPDFRKLAKLSKKAKAIVDKDDEAKPDGEEK